MKKSSIVMFLILQLLLIVTNLFDLNNNYLIVEQGEILKGCISIFSILYVLFLSNEKLKDKIIFIVYLSLSSLILLFTNNNREILNVLYYISTYIYLFSYYKNKKLKRYKLVNILTLLLPCLCLISLITKNNSSELELLINISLPILFTYFHTNKKIIIPIIILTLLTSVLNSMYLILLNTLIVFLILIFKSKSKNELLITTSLIVLTGFLIMHFNIFKESFNIYFDITISSILVILPLVIIYITCLFKYIKNNNKTLGLTLNVYTMLLYLIFGLLSLSNMIDGLLIIILSYIFIITIHRIENLSGEIKDEVTIMALHLGYGGVEQYISSLTKMLDKKITIISTYKLYEKTPFTYNATIEFLINYGPNTEEVKKAIKTKKHLLKEGVKAISILYKKKYENIEAIENINTKYIITTRDFHNSYVGFYSRKDTIKIATEHNYHNNDKKYISKTIKSVENLNYFVTVSKKLEEFYKDKVKCETVYIPNVLDKSTTKYSKAHNHSLISIGRLVKVKGYDDLIKVVELLKEEYSDISLTIVGDGEEKSHLMNLINKKKLNDAIHMTGYLNKAEIEKELLKNNVFVMTSLSESFGLVAIEASSYKLPVVAFDSAEGLKEVLSNGNGILVKNRNIKKMAEEISKLFKDSKYRNKIAEQGYENSKKYLSDNVKNMWGKIIH